MARPIKRGLDYFPHDVSLLKNKKFRKLKIKYGILAPYVYISLLELCYEDNGYYIDYSDKDSTIYAVLDDCQGKYCPSAETIENVIEDLVAEGLFSADKFKEQIITSRRIQINYYMGKLKSALIRVNPLYWLLSIFEMKELNEKSHILQNFINSETTGVNSEITRVNSETIPQSKEEKSKEKESREDKSIYTPQPKTSTGFKKPTLEEVTVYCAERKNNVNPQRFIDYYTSKDWMVGKSLMKDWKASVRLWESNSYNSNATSRQKLSMERQYTEEELDELLGTDNFDF